MKRLTEEIRKRRQQFRLPVEELLRDAGISEAEYRMLERGDGNTSLRVFENVVQALEGKVLLRWGDDVVEEREVPAPECIAGDLVHPSYLSLSYALNMYNLTPEAVGWYTSVSTSVSQTISFSNRSGNFIYAPIPKEAFGVGVVDEYIDGCVVHYATPEKALCDKMYSMGFSCKDMDESVMDYFLFENLRVDEDEFVELSRNDMISYARLYHTDALDLFASYLEEGGGS